MKVLFVYKDYFPVLGGIENHVKYLAEGMAARGHSVTVLVTNTAGQTRVESRGGVEVVKAGRIANVASAPLSLDLFGQLARQRPDIAHLHFPYPVGELAYLLRGHARKLVVTYHSDIVRQKRLLMLYRPFVRTLLSRADAISISNPSYTRFSPFVAPHAAKCVVIHHGQDLSRFAPTAASLSRARELRSAYGDVPLVLFVGRLRYYKGVEVLIAAMRDIAPPARALIVGAGPMESAWKSAAQSLGVAERVCFVGSVSDEELPAYYQAASVFVLPSIHPSETWGAVQVEAMASGLPCISTELGTGTSYVNLDGVTGLVVPPRDPRALARAIEMLLADEPLRTRLGAAARERAWREFTHDVMIDKTLALYQRLLGSAHAAGADNG